MLLVASVAISALLPAVLGGATPEETRFDELRRKRSKTPAGVSQVADEQYRRDLVMMLKQPGMASQPDLVRQVQAELQATAGAAAAAAAIAKPAPLNSTTARTATKGELTKLFANSEWRVIAKGAERTVITFLSDGTCSGWQGHRYWEVKAPDVLKLYINSPAKDRNAKFKAFRVDFSEKRAVADMTLGGEATNGHIFVYSQPVDRKH